MKRPDDRNADKLVRINTTTGEVYVNDERLPFFVSEEGVELEPFGKGSTLCRIELMVFASEVTFDGDPQNKEYQRLLAERWPA